MIRWYVEFETWAEGRLNVPWPYVIFEETGNYRSRENLSEKISESFQKSVFLSFNEARFNMFFSKFTNSVILGIELYATDPEDVKKQIQDVFGYCEFHGITEVTDENHARIKEVMEGAIKE